VSVRRRSERYLCVALGCLATFVAIHAWRGNGLAGAAPTPGDRSFVIKGESHKVYRRLRITSSTGDCIQITDSHDITIENSEIGPCAGNGVNISGGSDISIFDSFIHPETLSKGCCDHNDGVYAHSASRITVQGSVIAYGESNVEGIKNVSGLTVIGNFLLNPRGPYPRGQNVQAWNASNVVVRDNYALSSLDANKYPYVENQEDSVNFGLGSNFVASGNYVRGGHSPSGCGLIADKGANSAQFMCNTLVDTGQCGIGIASGTNQLVEANRVVNRNPVPKAGNVAVYVRNFYKNLSCGPVIVSNNIGIELRQGSSPAGFSNGGGCEPVTLKDNTWGEPARKQLEPVETKLSPPLIPPEPKNCVARSPYSTQTKWPPCD
jgi:parallel beta helix pectate lyase-like protein